MSKQREYYRVTRLEGGQPMSLPFAFAAEIANDRNLGKRVTATPEGNSYSNLLIPASLYTQELHGLIVSASEMVRGKELVSKGCEFVIEHCQATKGELRPTSDRQVTLEDFHIVSLPKEHDLSAEKQGIVTSFFASKLGTGTTFLAVIGGAAALHFGALSERRAPRDKPEKISDAVSSILKEGLKTHEERVGKDEPKEKLKR